MNIAIRKASILVAVVALVCSVSACNTMKGFGRDTAVVGEKIENEADRHIDEDEKRKDADRPR